MAGFSSRALVHPFTSRLLAVDLPGLTPAQGKAVTAFVIHRIDEMPSVLRIGVHCIAAPMRVVIAVPGANRILAWLISYPLPLVGEYVRMVRSLAYTYIWETWPSTLPDGSQADGSQADGSQADGSQANGAGADGARPQQAGLR